MYFILKQINNKSGFVTGQFVPDKVVYKIFHIQCFSISSCTVTLIIIGTVT
jgi:hypothetical protein